MKTINEVLIIMANNHLQDKFESILHETNSYIGYQASLKGFCETETGAVYKKMIAFGYEIDVDDFIGLDISDHSSYFKLPIRDEFLTLVKEFETIENDIPKLYRELGGNIPDKLYGWMYEWIEAVAYAYNPEKWEEYKMLYECLDVPFTQIITGEGIIEIERMLLEEMKKGAN